jgi:hypothetical protein
MRTWWSNSKWVKRAHETLRDLLHSAQCGQCAQCASCARFTQTEVKCIHASTPGYKLSTYYVYFDMYAVATHVTRCSQH